MSLATRVYRERRTVVLPVLVLLVANIGVFALGVLPLRRSVAVATEAEFQAATALAAARRENDAAKTARVRKQEADVELTKFYTEVLPRTEAQASQVTWLWLYQTARRNRVDFEGGQFKPEPVRESRLVRITGKAALRGTYADIRRFLFDVETAEEFVIIERVELGETGVVQQSTAGIVEVGLDVVTYYIASSPPEGGR